MSAILKLFPFFERAPYAPKRTGLLMRLYYFWQEYFTPAGHALTALFPLSMMVGSIPGFWTAWFFCGIIFLLALGTIISLFITCRYSKFTLNHVEISPVFEGETAKISATITVLKSRVDSVLLGCYRLEQSLKCEELDSVSVSSTDGPRILECLIHTKRRGAFPLKKVAANVTEIMGILRFPLAVNGTSELLVYPRPIAVKEFSFLTSGVSGAAFAPLLMPSLTRGMNFVGVREYREGDALRDLHHKAFARYGRPFTKEFETERGAGCILLVDTTIPNVHSRKVLEKSIRLAAGIGMWLLERNILGRFFIDDEEIELQGSNERERRGSLLAALARIPSAYNIWGKKPLPWSPAARPMDPVLRVGVFPKKDALVHKQIVLLATESSESISDDNTLFLNDSSFQNEVSL